MAKRKNQKGAGALSDIHNFIRDNKLISGGLGLLPFGPTQVASQVAGMLGYGRRRKRAPKKRRVMAGRGIFSDIGSGLGGAFSGLGGGLGSLAHGLFGSGKRSRVIRKVILI